MKRVFPILLLLSAGQPPLAAQEPDARSKPPILSARERAESAKLGPPQAWLGFQISKPDATLAAQLPELPPGIGFLVKSVSKSGPAELAGVREFDLIWKFADQLLVNEGQLAALLRLKKPGDVVAISVFRGGKPLSLPVTLGDAPPPVPVPVTDLAEAAVLSGDPGPMRVVNLAQKTAIFAAADGKAELRRHNGNYDLRVTDVKGGVIFEGPLNGEDDFKPVPGEWRRRAFALRRGLDQALLAPEASRLPARPVVAPRTASAE